ncbi:MAG: KH domain-containing protein [Fimbriimonadaceae bacterium]|nr:KH domain-containing protein [Fimbriimonadaceae bacterium]
MAYAEFVDTVVKAVVEKPEAIEIEEETEGNARTFFVHCDPEDVGKVIGKSGRVVSAIRCVVSAVAAKQREKAFVKVVTE